jgi:hypothetical protein
MNQIYHGVLKRKVIKCIKHLGKGICELLIDIELSFGVCNSVEFDESLNKIYIHVFIEDLDIVSDFEDLDEDDKIRVLYMLKTI